MKNLLYCNIFINNILFTKMSALRASGGLDVDGVVTGDGIDCLMLVINYYKQLMELILFRNKYMDISIDDKNMDIEIEKYDSCEKLLKSCSIICNINSPCDFNIIENIYNMFMNDFEKETFIYFKYTDQTKYIEYFNKHTFGLSLKSKNKDVVNINHFDTSINFTFGISVTMYDTMYGVFIDYLKNLQNIYKNKRDTNEIIKHKFIINLLDYKYLNLKFKSIIDILIKNKKEDNTFYYILMRKQYEEVNCINFLIKSIIRCFFSETTHFIYINNHKVRHVVKHKTTSECECCGEHEETEKETKSYSTMYYIVFGLKSNLCIKNRKTKKFIEEYKDQLYETKDRVKRKLILYDILPHTYCTTNTTYNYKINGEYGTIHNHEDALYSGSRRKNLYDTNLININENFKSLFKYEFYC